MVSLCFVCGLLWFVVVTLPILVDPCEIFTHISLKWRHMSVMVFQISAIRLFIQQLVQAHIKENTKDPHYCPFVMGIHRSPMNSHHKGSVMRKAFPFRDVIMLQDYYTDIDDCVSNHQPHGCLVNRLFKHRSKKTPNLRVTGLCEGNSPVTGEFPAQRASNAENVSIWWRHHEVTTKHIKGETVTWFLRRTACTHTHTTRPSSHCVPYTHFRSVSLSLFYLSSTFPIPWQILNYIISTHRCFQ